MSVVDGHNHSVKCLQSQNRRFHRLTYRWTDSGDVYRHGGQVADGESAKRDVGSDNPLRMGWSSCHMSPAGQMEWPALQLQPTRPHDLLCPRVHQALDFTPTPRCPDKRHAVME